MATRTTLTGWGRTAPSTAAVVAAEDPAQLGEVVRAAGRRGVLARGLGRSYGDAAQNAGGTVLDMTGMNRIHRVDADTGLVEVDAGVSLDQLMRRMLPFGLWVPVLPGTRQVTVGGAIAADVHGKNHHVAGSFGNHVRRLELLLADGTVRSLTPQDDEFWATVGGMGLTGVILRATLRLHATESAYFVVDTERTADLDELMARLSTGDDDYPYSVAWFDSVAGGSALGRAVITRGRSAARDELPPRLRRDPLAFRAPRLGTAPAVFPSGLLNRLTVGAFNELWYRKAPAHRTGEVQNITTFFHPLDVVGEWNRIYGPRGFLQYQFVVPFGAEDDFRRCVQTISASGHVSFLNVLKRFGAANPGALSFPMPGWTLAVDLPVRRGLDRLCAELDELVLAAGGRVYLAKDARVDPETFARMYPRLDEWRKVRDALDPAGVFTSDLARRLAL
jgi:decaprenylphospho-beta-D-ribofuranose 2-oxidase